MQTTALLLTLASVLLVSGVSFTPLVHFNGCPSGTVNGNTACALDLSFTFGTPKLVPAVQVTLLSQLTGAPKQLFSTVSSDDTGTLSFTRQITLCPSGRPGGQQTIVAEAVFLEAGTAKVLASASASLSILCPGRVTRDPKFYGFDGEIYFVKGEVGKTYAIISDRHVQVNALFDQHGAFYTHQTFMQEIGILIGSQHRIQLLRNGNIITNNRESTCLSLPSIYSPTFLLTCVLEGRDNRYQLDVARFHLEFFTKANGTMINMQASLNAKSALNLDKNRQIHGLLGQTADYDQVPRKGVPHAQQGEGWIEGVYTDYEVSHVFAYDFKYSQFTGENIPYIENKFEN